MRGLSRRGRTWAIGLGLVGLAVALTLGSALVGQESIPPSTTVSILSHQHLGGHQGGPACPGVSSDRCSTLTVIVWDLRIPAAILALAAGALLGISGATLQGVFRNPLADPYLFGLSAGAAVGAAAVFVLHVGLTRANLELPLFAFLGAVATAVAVLAIAGGRRSSVETLLLSGVALSYLLSGALSLLLLYNQFGNFQVDFWLLGGLSGATWDRDGIALGGFLLAGSLLAVSGRELNVLQLGEEVAESLGVESRRVRTRLVLLASVATAVAVAFTGVIGFVGLVSPHLVRRILGADYRIVLPGSALVGGVYLLAAADLSQVVLPGTILPLGILTAFTGAPFFLYLLARRRRQSSEPSGVGR